jgi:hypothetical protein
VIHIGIDDTDMPDTPGTNQLARALVRHVADAYRCVRITRHQLLEDPRVPCTSHNGSASIQLQPLAACNREQLVGLLRQRVQEWSVPGSDPGLCVAEDVPERVTEFALRCQRELVTQDMARSLADACGMHLEGLGGTEGGVIGALAAVGLSAAGDDGRVVQIGTWPDDLSGVQNLRTLEARGVEVRRLADGENVRSGVVDVGKHLRPNLRGHRFVLFVEPQPQATHGAEWLAVRLK